MPHIDGEFFKPSFSEEGITIWIKIPNERAARIFVAGLDKGQQVRVSLPETEKADVVPSHSYALRDAAFRLRSLADELDPIAEETPKPEGGESDGESPEEEGQEGLLSFREPSDMTETKEEDAQ